MMTATNDIFNNPDQLIRIWENERRTRDLNVQLMWENMKYFGTLIIGLVTANITLLGYLSSLPNHGTFPFDIRESLFLLPIVIIYLTYYARRDLTQRKKRFLLVITHLLKLEVLLGLHEDITQKLTSFKEDKYLFAEYQQNLSNIKTGDFIEMEMKKKDTAFNMMRGVYRLIRFLAIAIMILVGYLIIYT